MFVRRRRTAAGTLIYSILRTRRVGGHVVQDVVIHLGPLPKLDNVTPVDVRWAVQVAIDAAAAQDRIIAGFNAVAAAKAAGLPIDQAVRAGVVDIPPQLRWTFEAQELARTTGVYERMFGKLPEPPRGDRTMHAAALRLYHRDKRRVAILRHRLRTAERHVVRLHALQDELEGRPAGARMWHREARQVRPAGIHGKHLTRGRLH